MTTPQGMLADALHDVLSWAEQRCPCENEQPDPCPLCGVSVASLEGCKAIDAVFPKSIKDKIDAALRQAPQGREALEAIRLKRQVQDAELALKTWDEHRDSEYWLRHPSEPGDQIAAALALTPAVAPDADENSSDVAMDLIEANDSLATAQWYVGQLEAVINQVCARLGVEPAALIQGNAIELIPAVAPDGAGDNEIDIIAQIIAEKTSCGAKWPDGWTPSERMVFRGAAAAVLAALSHNGTRKER